MNIKLILLSIVFSMTSFIPTIAQETVHKKTSKTIKTLKVTSHLIELGLASAYINHLYRANNCEGCINCYVFEPIAIITLLINGLRGLKNELYA